MARAPGFAKHPAHQVEIEPFGRRVRAVAGGETIAETSRALRVLESRHDPVYYFPRADVRADLLERTDHHTYCPFKGQASYWTLRAGGRALENAVWGYEDPYDEVAGLKDHVAFYADRVDIQDGPS